MTPKLFLSHASEDKEIARRLAHALHGAGIDTFFDEWEIRSGDSIRQKIDEGLGGCSHFLILLTPTSVNKPWVNAEMDAGFVRKVEGACRFIVLRKDLAASELPPLLKGLLSPELKDFDRDVKSLIADILGVSKKPPLGQAPAFSEAPTPLTRTLSPAAARLAELMVRESETGTWGDPELSPTEVREKLDLPDHDIVDAVEELEDLGLIEKVEALGCGAIGFVSLNATEALFVKVDGQLMPWDPKTDALQIAADLVNEDSPGIGLEELGNTYGWAPRRLNPAASFLIAQGLVEHDDSMGCHPFVCHWIEKTTKTRRFVRDHS